jgi:hypothetical protein
MPKARSPSERERASSSTRKVAQDELLPASVRDELDDLATTSNLPVSDQSPVPGFRRGFAVMDVRRSQLFDQATSDLTESFERIIKAYSADPRSQKRLLDILGLKLLALSSTTGDNFPDVNNNKNKLTLLLNKAAVLIQADPALQAVIKSHPIFQVTAQDQNWDPSLPRKAPQLWQERPRSDKRTAIEFLEQVYADWLPAPLTLTFLRSFDQPLHSTLSTWLARNRDSVPPRLQTFFAGGKAAREAALDREIRELGIKEPADVFAKLPDDRKRAARLYQAILRRKRKFNSYKRILT